MIRISLKEMLNGWAFYGNIFSQAGVLLNFHRNERDGRKGTVVKESFRKSMETQQNWTLMIVPDTVTEKNNEVNLILFGWQFIKCRIVKLILAFKSLKQSRNLP